VIVYSTCSNEPEENLGLVESFLARHGEFSLEESRESIPFETGHDGAFAALLKKRG
jgi:16S rRNA (cytosine967-C5)-methyltransferase